MISLNSTALVPKNLFLENKIFLIVCRLSELKSVGYGKDKTLLDEQDRRRQQQLVLMQQHRDIASLLPPEAAAQLMHDANYTLCKYNRHHRYIRFTNRICDQQMSHPSSSVLQLFPIRSLVLCIVDLAFYVNMCANIVLNRLIKLQSHPACSG